MKVITLEIDDERYEDLKSFKQLYAAQIVSDSGRARPPEHAASSSSHRKIPWHEITLEQLQRSRPDLIRAILEAKGSWAAAAYDVVSAIEANKRVVQLKQESAEDWLSRRGFKKPDGCLLAAIALAGMTLAATVLGFAVIIWS